MSIGIVHTSVGATTFTIRAHFEWGHDEMTIPRPPAAHKVKLTVKGGAAVDPESELEDTHHVLQDKAGVLHTAVLGLVDITRGTNSYYKLQLLEGDSSKSYYVFRSWGRVGTTIGGCKVEVGTA